MTTTIIPVDPVEASDAYTLLKVTQTETRNLTLWRVCRPHSTAPVSWSIRSLFEGRWMTIRDCDNELSAMAAYYGFGGKN